MISYRSSQAWFWRLSVSLGLILVFSGCPRKNDDCTTCPPVRLITLSSSRVSCTEAWLKLSVANLEKTRISLEQDGNAFADLTLGVFDTTLYYDSLTPGRTYSFQASRQPSKDESDVSEPLTVRTMDTTSHDFTWTVTTLGDGNSSVLNDVAIINDTLAYAVGEIYLKDSTGKYDSEAYGLAQWNGRGWELRKMHYTSPLGGTFALSDIRGISYANGAEIWLAAGSVFKWNGSSPTSTLEFSRLTLVDPNATIVRLWGTSSSDLFGVGGAGTIVHYNGSSWQKIESGTTSDFKDIVGSQNTSQNSTLVRAVASSTGSVTIVSLSNNSITNSLPWPFDANLLGVWISPGLQTYVCGEGAVWKHDGSQWMPQSGLTDAHVYNAIRGNAENDIVVTAWQGVVCHFNGRSWHLFNEIPKSVWPDKVAIKNNTIIAVGSIVNGMFAEKAVVAVGKR